jgi:ABC-type polysaccharide/polyol phosphate export permease
MLAYQDIKLRYRRSVLGPFWLTISMAVTVYSMGFLYAKLFHTELSEYYPFLVGGMLAWSLISAIVTDATEGLVVSENLIKQIKLPYTLYVHRIATRNVLIFLHNVVVIIPIMIIFHDTVKVNLNTLLIIPGILYTYVNAVIYGLLLAMIGARYRDIAQVIKSLVQVIFFITPVMWKPGVLSGRSYWIVDYNPFYGFIECIREPLLGRAPTVKNLLSVLVVTVIGLILTSKIFIRYRSRIVYWL